MAKRILVPLDQSPLAEAVLPLVGEVARGSGATVRLLRVAPIPDNRVDAEGRVIVWAAQEVTRLEAEGKDYLQTLELQLAGVPVECVVRFGSAVEEILQEAEAFGADLAWIEAEVEELVSQARFDDAHGIALFACGALGLREVLPLRVPFDDAFVVSDAPFLPPLARAVETAPPEVVAFVDGESARLIPVGPEGTGKEVALESYVPGHHRRGGWANLAMAREPRHLRDHGA